MTNLKTCTLCGDTKQLSDFYFRTRGNTHYKHCKACHRNFNSRHEGKESKFSSLWWKERFSEEELKLFSKLKNLCTKARLRSKEFDPKVDWEYLYDLWVNQNGECAYSGMPLSIEANHPHSVSLDRVDSSKGYIVGNLQLLSWTVNKMKMDLDEEDFLLVCLMIAEKQK